MDHHAAELVLIFAEDRIGQDDVTRRQIGFTRAGRINAHGLKRGARVAGTERTEHTREGGQQVSLLSIQHVVSDAATDRSHRVIGRTDCQLGQLRAAPDVGTVEDDADLFSTAELVDAQRYTFRRHLNGAGKVGAPVGDFELVAFLDVLGDDRVVGNQADRQELRAECALLVDVVRERIVNLGIRPVEKTHCSLGMVCSWPLASGCGAASPLFILPLP